MPANRALIGALRDGLRAAADPVRAPQMQAYMKSTMPYRGVPSPAQRTIFREAFTAHPLEHFEAWRDTMLVLWREAKFREERYAAIALAERRTYRAYLTHEAMPILEEFVVTGAWWDLVDETAPLIGEVLRSDRRRMTAEMRRWSRDPHLWKRRVSIICQLRFKTDTDLALLYDAIERNLEDRDFFIRKAIGWALRQYAKTDAEEVRRFVRVHADRLSGLSIREALKNIGGAASIAS